MATAELTDAEVGLQERVLTDEDVGLTATVAPAVAPAPQLTESEVAQRLGIPDYKPGGEVVEASPFDQEAFQTPLVRIPETVKTGIGRLALSAILPGIGAALPERVHREIGESLGGLIEGLSSPEGIATIPAAALAPQLMIPYLSAQGIKAGAEQVAEGKPIAGATTIGISALPAAVPLAKAATARGAKPAPAAPAQAAPPPLPPVDVPMLPALLPHAESKAVFSQPFGTEHVPSLGRIVNPNARTSVGPLPEGLAAYAAERHGIAPAAASSVGLRLKAAGIDEAFPSDPKTGEFTTVQPTRPGQSLHPHDVLTELQKAPGSYILTAEQRAAFGQLEKWRSELEALEKKHGTGPAEIAALAEEGDTSYFPRIVIERPETDVAPLGGGSRVGAKQFFQKKPIFETEQEGVARGYRYEPSVVARAVTRTERAYRAIADRRLANDPTLGARTRKRVESELREAYSEEIGAGIMSEEKLQQIVSSVEHKGTVWGHPGFVGKIFDAETANTLSKAFPAADSSFRHNFIKINNALKALRLSADVGAPFIQGLPTLFRNPGIWAKATGNAYKALFDERVMARYAQENAAPITELAQHGSSVGRLPEMLAGLEKGSIVERIPVAGAVFRAGGRHFETFLDVAKVELWKAWREVTPPEQRLPVIRALESQLLSGRMESAGVTRNRALVERALLLAPSYYRGAVNLVAAMGERGVAGQVARRALTAYMAGGLATFYGLGLALGMKEETLQARLDPTDPTFMLWEVQIGDRRLNVGFGGIYRSLLRLAGNMVKTSAEHPEKWVSLTPHKNPLVRWYRGHAAAIPALAWDALTGRDYIYNEADVTNLGQAVLPIAASPVIRGEGATAAAASVAGLTAFEEKGR